MNFEYLETKRSEASIDIETPGLCAIQAFTDEGDEYYLSISTKMGFTEVKQFGPFNEEDTMVGFSYLKYYLEYDERKIAKIIQKFLNNTSCPKTQVFEIEFKDINKKLNEVKL